MNNVAVVTGASNGIGAAVATELLAAGWQVVGVDRKPLETPELAGIAWVVGDVATELTHDEAVVAASSLGTLNGWVNNAGIIESCPLHLLSHADAERTLRTNLYGTIAGTRAALRAFISNGAAGSIVNVSSVHARGGFPGTPVYDASKGAVEALTRYAAVEYGHLGIRVNAVAPGAIRTEMLATAIANAPDPMRLEADYAALHPLARLGEAFEVARAVRFLLSHDSAFVSGVVLPVDGAAAARVFAFPPHPDVPVTVRGRTRLEDQS